MTWSRPLEQFIELALVLWLVDVFIKPLSPAIDTRRAQRGSTTA
jgi:hypothetical protein